MFLQVVALTTDKSLIQRRLGREIRDPLTRGRISGSKRRYATRRVIAERRKNVAYGAASMSVRSWWAMMSTVGSECHTA